MRVELEFIIYSNKTTYAKKKDNGDIAFHYLLSLLKKTFNTSRAAIKLPNTPDTERIIACHPNFPKLFIIRLFDPIDMPRINSNKKIVIEIVLSVFCKIDQLRNP